MQLQEQIANEALQYLKQKGKIATPDIYREFFCKLAKKHNITTEDCQFKAEVFSRSLPPAIKKKCEAKQFSSEKEFIDFLSAELSNALKSGGGINVTVNKTVGNDSKEQEKLLPYQYLPLLLEALSPSLSEAIMDNITQMQTRLNQEPELLSHREIEREVDALIVKRIESDKEEVSRYAVELNLFLDQIAEKTGGVIDKSDIGSNALLKIRETLDKFKNKEFNSGHLEIVRDKMVKIARSMENELSGVKKELEGKKEEMGALQGRIKELEDNLKKAEQESSEDFLTKTLTKRALNGVMMKAEESYQRHGFKYSIVFLDIDHFKKINDTYGHDAGDKVLSGFAKIVKEQIRKVDSVGRYGGEEFIVVLPGDPLEGAQSFAEKIRSKIENSCFKYKTEEIAVTMSAGVACREESEGMDALLDLADSRLYEAKTGGRNQVRPPLTA